MDNVLGIICEYNPFHNGHLYHLNESKKIANCKYSIAVISGNFTQRGEPSLIDKWSKAEMAIRNGVDLVIELPTIYSISSAENFANGAVKILNSLKIVDCLSFGSECGDISILNDIVQVLIEEPKAYQTLLAHELAKGISFPNARENALLMYLGNVRRFANILSSPNNILGIEYLKALKLNQSKINPITLKRQESEHNTSFFTSSSRYASGSAIRNTCFTNDITNIQRVVPEISYDIIENKLENGTLVRNISVFDKEILFTLRKMSVEEIAELPDVSEGLEFSIKKIANSCNTVQEFLNSINSKRYTQSRIQRILLYAMLGITKKDMLLSKNTIPYVRVLGFNKNGEKLIGEIVKQNSKLPVITSVKKFMDTNTNKNLKLFMEKDIEATNIYTLGYQKNSEANLDYTHKLIIDN